MRHLSRRVAFVQMSASGHHGDVQLTQFSEHQFSRMSRGGRYGPARNLGVGDGNRIGQFIGERAQSAAQHDGDVRFAPGDAHGCRRPRAAFCQSGYKSMPAMQADMKFAMVPAATAFRPMRARSDLRLGASAPMPPIWIAMELRFAKPHSA